MRIESFDALYGKTSPMMQVNDGYVKWLDYKGIEELEQRAMELDGRTFPHLDRLVQVIRSQQRTFGDVTEPLDEKLSLLAKGEAYTMVTGQQVGVFGGPLFAVYKLLTVIKQSNRAERMLGKPVIPIFWMATEDHDYAEINHVFTTQSLSRTLKKDALSSIPLAGKASVGDLEFERLKIELVQMLQRLLMSETETAHTPTLYAELVDLIQESHSFAQFFGGMMRKFVGNDFVLLDPHHKEIRELEVPMFKQIVKKHDSILNTFRHTFEEGMPEVELNKEAAHLFYHDGTRELLTKTEDAFTTKRGHRFTETELLEMIEQHPERFSNNVVSRPLMQDFLLPTLGYVGGPGEISYWLQLRPLFHLFDWKMPLLLPRLGALIVSSNDEKKLSQEHVTVEEYIQAPLPDHLFDDEAFDLDLYPFRTLTESVSQEAKKHGRRFESQARYALEKLAEEMRADAKRRQYRLNERRIRLSTRLMPMNAPQERILSMVPMLNRHGVELFKRIKSEYERSEYERCLIKV
ncbi:bacillithiol biosynthesis cysteine-adding enzyme BshC [Exiguobacterium algae]|uniref:bacillithiol biosynthesis cysteine-adding enzyme BshC n=1 Tax=Exiguobacterium algae TaxID=2751250 RepID=UPI0030B86201